ncbi:hypothetical protein IFM89_000111 [Coptis chinensis]|uniref:Protein IQ-DOMAIN 1 n=1 Tax=Coptis chinensis TaxID=261450 RepID=A0A835LYG0_9MAGN|nr:hypothetical protein IFM89_000111 [Coptis chinensis]
MGLTGGLVKSVFSKNRSVGSHDAYVRSYGLNKRRWSSVRSYLCGDEYNSVLADADSTSIRSSEDTVTQHVAQEDLNSEDVQGEAKEQQITKEEHSSPAIQSNEENAATVIQSAFRRFLEDWDDSTVSSNISKLRIQSKLEATSRRERALAYAFSQQLRLCSKKKSNQCDTSEVNMGWSWLERWMATRPPETYSVEDRMSKQNEPIPREPRFTFGKKNFDVAAEEESCGSNEVSVMVDHLIINAPDVKYSHKAAKNRLKSPRTVSRRKTVPSYQISTQWMKETRKDCLKEAEKDRKHKKAQQSWSTGEIKQTVESPE